MTRFMTNYLSHELAQAEALMLRYLHSYNVLGPMAIEHLSTGGKRLRSRLALEATHALGGSIDAAIPWAAACEMLHNATLVHDDFQDGDTLRRGQPTTWVQHGAAQAINVGDLMLMLPYQIIEQIPLNDIRWPLCQAMASRMSAVIGGQAQELLLNTATDPTWDIYIQTIRGKTSALFELPVLGAAIIAGKTFSQAAELAVPFQTLGLLFQLQDDVIDLYGDKGRGAPGADIREGKVSALVVQHLTLAPQDKPWLLSILRQSRNETPESDVQKVIARFKESGALEQCLRQLSEMRSAILHAPALAGQKALLGVAASLVERVFVPLQHLFV